MPSDTDKIEHENANGRKDKPKPILVTGGPRCGTTLVGAMLCESPGLTYVYEPFNANQASGVCRAKFPCWFIYVTDANAEQYSQHLRRTLSLRYNLLRQIVGLRRPKDVVRLAIDPWQFALGRLRGNRPVMKDPIAVFSADWLARTFGMDVVVTVRHPAGFAASRKNRGDTHPFDHFLHQPLLMEEVLSPFRTEIEAHAAEQHSIVEQSALLWKLIYYQVGRFRERHDDWLFVRLEDLSEDPERTFQRIFAHIGEDYNEDIRLAVLEHCSSANPKEARKVGGHVGRTLKRDSKATVKQWKKQLSQEEIDQVRQIVGETGERFYPDADW